MSHTETSPFLPVATGPQVREYATGMVRRNSRTLTLVIVLQTLGAIAGLAGPAVVGQLVDALTAGTTATYITTMVALLAGALLTQAVLVRFARLHAMVLGEKAFAELREDFLSTVTSLPLSIVERSGTGDLVSRTTHDINRVQHTVRFGVPQILVSTATVLMTLIATIAVSPPWHLLSSPEAPCSSAWHAGTCVVPLPVTSPNQQVTLAPTQTSPKQSTVLTPSKH